MASSLFDIFQLVGYTVWQLQTLESTLGVYFVIAHEVPLGAAREDVQSLFERAEHRTLGRQLTLLRDRSPEGSALVERLERLVPRRNWLVHHSRHNSRALLKSPDGMLLLAGQIEQIAEEALALGEVFALLLEDHVVRKGLAKEELERRAAQIRDAWTLDAP